MAEGETPAETKVGELRLSRTKLDEVLTQATGGKFVVSVKGKVEQYMTLRYALAESCDAKGQQEVQSREEKYHLYKLMERLMDKESGITFDAEEIVLMRKRVDVWTGLLVKGGSRVFGLISDIIGRSKK